jgi:hypothetical protein
MRFLKLYEFYDNKLVFGVSTKYLDMNKQFFFRTTDFS